VVPIDLSTHAVNALRHALVLAAAWQARVTLFRVITPEDVAKGVTAEHAQRGLQLLAEEHDTNGVSIGTEVRTGDFITMLVALCDEQPTHLLAMGTRGASGLRKALFGSNTVRAMQSTDVPMLVVPQGARLTELPVIALAADLHELPDDNALDLLRDVALAHGAEVRILHFANRGHLSMGEVLEKHREEHILQPDVKVTFRNIGTPDPLDGLELYLDHHPHIGMLTMVKRAHRGLRLLSTDHTKEMAYHTHMPLLVLREG
jgi:nucleotide-binding universal stress UspA family protein